MIACRSSFQKIFDTADDCRPTTGDSVTDGADFGEILMGDGELQSIASRDISFAGPLDFEGHRGGWFIGEVVKAERDFLFRNAFQDFTVPCEFSIWVAAFDDFADLPCGGITAAEPVLLDEVGVGERLPQLGGSGVDH